MWLVAMCWTELSYNHPGRLVKLTKITEQNKKTEKKNPFSRSDKAAIKSGTAVGRVDTEKNCTAWSLLSADTSPLPEL